jgi:hypothetical protein
VAIRRKERLVREHEAAVSTNTMNARNPIEVIEKAAKEGRWVVIASLRFPRYWLKIVELLTKLK